METQKTKLSLLNQFCKTDVCVVRCCKLNNTRICDEHLFGQVSTPTGRYHFVAQFCTHEDGLAYILGMPSIDDVMSYNLLTTFVYKKPKAGVVAVHL